ncbi:MAG: C40 family peptidase, partial [Armatimonadetes bacterium]|nr:C40 family peptidase [Armatimonadota bacterium]
LLAEKADGYREARQLQWVNCDRRDATPVTLPLGVTGDYNARAPQSAELVATGDGTWWTQNGVVFHSDATGTKRECYVPWNGAGGTVSALIADEHGAFVATNKGVRRIVPGQLSETDGYNGYVRVPLGDEFAEPRTDRDRQLLTGIEEWQGVPYKWGGNTKTGVDCSGFVSAMHSAFGVSIPRTSAAMGSTKQGVRVKSELRYGDTLVYPGHVALYLGNGRTAETVGGDSRGAPGSVSKSTIWRRRDVVVKRFLP